MCSRLLCRWGELLRSIPARFRGTYQPPPIGKETHTLRSGFGQGISNPSSKGAAWKPPGTVGELLEKLDDAMTEDAWGLQTQIHPKCPFLPAEVSENFLSGLEILLQPGPEFPACSFTEPCCASVSCAACGENATLDEFLGEEAALRCPQCQAPYQPAPLAQFPIDDLENGNWAFTTPPHLYRFSIQFSEYKLGIMSWDEEDPALTRRWNQLRPLVSDLFRTEMAVTTQVW